MSRTEPVHPIKAALRQQWPVMTQAALARRLEISEGSLSHYLAIPPWRPVPEGFYTAVAHVLNSNTIGLVYTPESLRPPLDAAPEEEEEEAEDRQESVA